MKKKLTVADVLRSILGYILAILFFFPIMLVLYPIYWIVRIFSKLMAERYALVVARCALRLLMFLVNVKTEKIGYENVPDGPVFYVANHRGFFDMITFYPAVKGRLGFVAKKNFKKFPPLALWMKAVGCIFLDRDDVRQAMTVIKEAVAGLKDGKSIYICPEGTRSRKNECLPFREGAFKIGEKVDCPVIPVTIIDSELAFESGHFPLICATTVKIIFGKPVRLYGLSRDEYRETCKQIEKEINETYKKYAVKE